MFEYLQQCLSVNYRYFIEFICKKDLKNEIYTNITRYFLTTAYRIFISHIIKLRFEEDISNLNEFLLFNFID